MKSMPFSSFAVVALIAAQITVLPACALEPDLAGRTALMTEIEAALGAERWAEAEQEFARFRERYPPSSRVKGWDNGNEVVYLFPSVLRLAGHHEKAGNLDKVLALYDAELEALSSEVPHDSWGQRDKLSRDAATLIRGAVGADRASDSSGR